MKAGVIDPTKVTRIALENAASIAGMLLTTECVIADKPKKEELMFTRAELPEWAEWTIKKGNHKTIPNPVYRFVNGIFLNLLFY